MVSVHEMGPRFRVEGALRDVRRLSAGHINDTYVATYDAADGPRRYVHQRINRSVFAEPDRVVTNHVALLDHLARRGPTARPSGPSLPSLVRTVEGGPFFRDTDGEVWRTTRFVEGVTFTQPPDTATVFEAARAYACFERAFLELPGDALRDTIPGFHDTPARLRRLREVAVEAPPVRAAHAAADLGFAMDREELAGRLTERRLAGAVPARTAHNDTKLTNIVFSPETVQARCVLDLDTAMQGTVLHDFGDMVRSMTCPSAEDTKKTRTVRVDKDLFAAVAGGYLGVASDFLCPEEKQSLVLAALVITLETGIRFLTDYLEGDVYFRTSRPDQNLDRCRTQFALVSDMERHRAELETVVRRM